MWVVRRFLARVGGQCNFEGLPSLIHESPGSFQNGKRRMPFIEMADNIAVKVESVNGKRNNCRL